MDGDFKIFVIDASVLGAVLFPDEQQFLLKKRVANILALGAYKVMVPEILRFELGNILGVGVQRKRFTQEAAKTYLHTFKTMDLRFEGLNLEEVLELALKNKITFYDAAYVWLALEEKAVLLTLDERMKEVWRELKKT